MKSHASPDEALAGKDSVEDCKHEGFTIGGSASSPAGAGRSASSHGQDRPCQISHVGYAVSGRIKVRMKDGTEKIIAPASPTRFRPGTMPGSKAKNRRGIEVMSADVYAKS